MSDIGHQQVAAPQSRRMAFMHAHSGAWRDEELAPAAIASFSFRQKAHEEEKFEAEKQELEQEIDADITEALSALAALSPTEGDSPERQALEARLSSLQGSKSKLSSARTLEDISAVKTDYRTERNARQTDAVAAEAKDAVSNMTAAEKVDYYAGEYERKSKAIAGEGGQMDQRRAYGERTASRLDQIGRESGFNTKPFNDLRQQYQSEADAKRKKGDVEGALDAEAGAFAVQGEQIRQMLETEKSEAKRQELLRLQEENAKKLKEIEDNRRDLAKKRAKKEAAEKGLTGQAAEDYVKRADEEALKAQKDARDKATEKAGRISGLSAADTARAQLTTAVYERHNAKLGDNRAAGGFDDDAPEQAHPATGTLGQASSLMKSAGVVHSSNEDTPKNPDGQMKPTQVADAKAAPDGKDKAPTRAG